MHPAQIWALAQTISSTLQKVQGVGEITSHKIGEYIGTASFTILYKAKPKKNWGHLTCSMHFTGQCLLPQEHYHSLHSQDMNGKRRHVRLQFEPPGGPDAPSQHHVRVTWRASSQHRWGLRSRSVPNCSRWSTQPLRHPMGVENMMSICGWPRLTMHTTFLPPRGRKHPPVFILQSGNHRCFLA